MSAGRAVEGIPPVVVALDDALRNIAYSHTQTITWMLLHPVTRVRNNTLIAYKYKCKYMLNTMYSTCNIHLTTEMYLIINSQSKFSNH